jgi:hypothetical protein
MDYPLRLLLFLAAQCAFSENPRGRAQLILFLRLALHFLLPGAFVICFEIELREIAILCFPFNKIYP